jgi:hypothetical protein
MVSQFMLATAIVPVIANLVVAGPIEERGFFSPKHAPSYCQIIGNENAAKPFSYIDLSKGESCCRLPNTPL